MAIEYTNLFRSKVPQIHPELGFLVSKYIIWQPCTRLKIKTLFPGKVAPSAKGQTILQVSRVARFFAIQYTKKGKYIPNHL
jgi:hypothetical protein